MLGNLGSIEVFIVFVVLLGLFGSKKMKDLAKGLGDSTKQVKKIQKGFEQAAGLEDEQAETDQKTDENKDTQKSQQQGHD